VASLGLHLALGGGGTFLGAALASSGQEECCTGAEAGAVLGLLASQVIATAIDVASFAYEEVPSGVTAGPLFAPPDPARGAMRKSPAGLQLSFRF